MFKFFIEALVDGVRNNLRKFIGAAGFICALALVYGATDVFPHRHKNVEIPADLSEENQNAETSRSLASLSDTNSNSETLSASAAGSKSDSRSSTHSDDNQGSGNLAGSASKAVPPAQNTTTTANGVAGNYNSNNGGYVPYAPRIADPGPPPAGTNDNGYVGGGITSPNTQASPSEPGTTGSTGSTNSNNGSSTSTTGAIRVAEASLIASGGGSTTGTGMKVEATVGAVTSPNHHENTNFTLISGLAGILYSN